MNGIHVVMIVRRFWPLQGCSERMIADLSQELLRQGASPSILTARFDARWPSEVVVREVAVHRLPFPRRFGWGVTRYSIALSRWLRRNQPDIDLVYAARLTPEAHAIVGACQESGTPVVLRAEPDEAWEELSSSRRSATRILRSCQAAAAVVAPTDAVGHRLVAAGFSPQRVHIIHDGVAPAAPRTNTIKLAARAALAGVNEDLRVGLNMPVVTAIGRLETPYGFARLITAWKRIAATHPDARLWFIGDGSQRERLYRAIQDADLHGRVLLPGSFDDLEDVMQASDLLVMPSASVDQTNTILRAMAAQLPLLAASGADHDNLVQDGLTGRRLTELVPARIAGDVLDALAQTERGEQMAAAAYRFVSQHRSLPDAARQHHRLFRNLVQSFKRRSP